MNSKELWNKLYSRHELKIKKEFADKIISKEKNF